ncbi:MFS transporter [Agromyces albus]|uniref:MFS transporter n=1 Tax=Agromyces albus TaxID=205332 RepID=UPI0019D70834|nr:MFS transporter [Agromyces albus]
MTGAQSNGPPLARYVIAATLARTSDGGAVVAIVLLVNTSGGPGWLAGLLAASITAPHLLGPFVARRLDTAEDGRTVIAWSAVIHALTLAGAVLLFPFTPALVPAVLLIASGLVGPMLTGGISSRLPRIAGPELAQQRRAQGWDVATYGIGGTVGPSVVAAISAWASPTVAALTLAAGALMAAAFIRLLPYQPREFAATDVPRPARTLALMLRSARLRRTLYLTVVVALSVAVLPITAVNSASMLNVDAASAALLTAAYGLGSLTGSFGVMVRPLRGSADRLMTRLAALIVVALAAVMLAPSFPIAAITYVVAGTLNSYFFAATLAARSEYSPRSARAQVFVWVGALKITAGSAGTALAGALVGIDPVLPLVAGAVVTAAAVLVSAAERRIDPGVGEAAQS